MSDQPHQHDAAYAKLLEGLTAEQRARLTASSDQLEALVDETVEMAGGILHHLYLGELDKSSDHHAEIIAQLTSLDTPTTHALIGRLAVLVAGHRYRFTALDGQTVAESLDSE